MFNSSGLFSVISTGNTKLGFFMLPSSSFTASCNEFETAMLISSLCNDISSYHCIFSCSPGKDSCFLTIYLAAPKFLISQVNLCTRDASHRRCSVSTLINGSMLVIRSGRPWFDTRIHITKKYLKMCVLKIR